MEAGGIEGTSHCNVAVIRTWGDGKSHNAQRGVFSLRHRSGSRSSRLALDFLKRSTFDVVEQTTEKMFKNILMI